MIALRKHTVQRNRLLTRYSNTGLDRQNTTLALIEDNYSDNIKAKENDNQVAIFCDWLTINGKLNEADLSKVYVDVLCGRLFNENYEVSEKTFNRSFYRGGVKFRDVIKNDIGVQMFVTPTGEDDEYRIILKLSGETMASLFHRDDLLSVARFLYYLDELGLTVSRYDNTISDPRKKIDITTVIGAVLAKQYTGVRTHGVTMSGNTKNGITGVTVYLGSRQSDCFYRLYDEYTKHKTVANRLEQELKDSKAKQVVGQLVNYYADYILAIKKLDANMIQEDYVADEWMNYDDVIRKRFNNNIVDYLKSILLGGVRFINTEHRKANGSIKDCPSLPFWQEFIDYILGEKIPQKLQSRRTKPTVRDKGKWIYKSVKGSLGIIRKGLSSDDFLNFMRYLLMADKNKEYPKEVEQDREIMIAELHKNGIQALLEQERIIEAKEEFGIEFDTCQHETATDYLLLDNNSRVYGKANTKLFDYLNQMGETIKEIYEKFPIVFEQIVRFLKYDEREFILCYCNDFKEDYMENKKAYNASILI